MALAIWTAVFALVAFGLLLFAAYSSTVRMKNVTFERAKIRPDSETSDHVNHWMAFIKQHNMKPIGHFITNPATPIIMSVWQNAQPAAFFVLYTAKTSGHDGIFKGAEFVTILDAKAGTTLTTTTKTDGLTVPTGPGCWVQCFTESTETQFMTAHTKALQWLRQEHKIVAGPQPENFADSAARCIQNQVASFVRRPHFPLIALWRFSITRHMLSGKPVWKQ
jgi:hypothetical protein